MLPTYSEYVAVPLIMRMYDMFTYDLATVSHQLSPPDSQHQESVHARHSGAGGDSNTGKNSFIVSGLLLTIS